MPRREKDRDTQGEHGVKTKAEIGVIQLELHQSQGTLGATRTWKRQEASSPRGFRGSVALLTP